MIESITIMADVDMDILEELVKGSYDCMTKKYG